MSADVCEFELEIEARMTFTRYRVVEEISERGIAGTIYYFSDTTGELLPHPLSDQSCAGIPIGNRGCTPPGTVDAATYRPSSPIAFVPWNCEVKSTCIGS